MPLPNSNVRRNAFRNRVRGTAQIPQRKKMRVPLVYGATPEIQKRIERARARTKKGIPEINWEQKGPLPNKTFFEFSKTLLTTNSLQKISDIMDVFMESRDPRALSVLRTFKDKRYGEVIRQLKKDISVFDVEVNPSIAVGGDSKILSVLKRIQKKHGVDFEEVDMFIRVNKNIHPESFNLIINSYLKKRIEDLSFKLGWSISHFSNAPSERTWRLYHSTYGDNEFNSRKRAIVRREQPKTGQSVLLGGKLRRKATVRLMTRFAYEAWLKAFSAKELWKKLGFKYIPIEPILMKNGQPRASIVRNSSFAKMYGGEVRVYAGVLPFETEKEFIEREMQKSEVPFGVNPDLFDSQKELYYQKSSKNYKEIELQISKINLGLRELGIDHGHKHDRNYLVQMYKGKPRVYLIDFDQAKIGLTY